MFSLPVHGKLCEFFHGDGEGEGSVSIVSMVTIFLTPGVLSKISTQSSRPSRRGLDAAQRDNAATMGSGIFVLDTIFIFQTGFADI